MFDLALLVKVNWHFTNWNYLNVVPIMQHFHVSMMFACLQIFFSIFLLKCAIKWTRSWNSSRNFEFRVISLKRFLFETWKYFIAVNSSFIFQLFAPGHIHNVSSTLVNVVKFDVDLTFADVAKLYQPSNNVETALKYFLGII